MKYLKVTAFALVFTAMSLTAFAQKSKSDIDFPFSISAGFSSLTITGNNPNINQNYYIKTIKDKNYGGFDGFMNGIQPGYSLMFEASLDQAGTFKIPVGLEYITLRSARRYSYASKVDNVDYIDNFYFENSYDVFSVFTGANWFFWKVPTSNVKFFLGAELRANFIGKGDFQLNSQYTHLDENGAKIIDSVTDQSTSKEAVVRYGAALKFGLEAEIFKPWFIHVGFGMSAMNAVGRDDSHGNLFVTAENPGDKKKELLVTTFNFNFMIQYRFGL